MNSLLSPTSSRSFVLSRNGKKSKIMNNLLSPTSSFDRGSFGLSQSGQKSKKTRKRIRAKSLISVVDFKNALSEILHYQESEIRLIMVLAIFAFCCLALVTSFVVIIMRLYQSYIVPEIVPFKERLEIKGLTSSEVLLGKKFQITDLFYNKPILSIVFESGAVRSFDPRTNSLSKLDGLTKLPSGDTDLFAFEDKRFLYFVRTRYGKAIVSYDKALMVHREIVGSQFKYGQPSDIMLSAKIGDKIIIVRTEGGVGAKYTNFGSSSGQRYGQSFIWHIRRQKWTKGPTLHHDISKDYHIKCFVGLNRTSAVITTEISLGIYNFDTYNYARMVEIEERTALPFNINSYSIEFDNSCAAYQNKQGEIIIIIKGMNVSRAQKLHKEMTFCSFTPLNGLFFNQFSDLCG